MLNKKSLTLAFLFTTMISISARAEKLECTFGPDAEHPEYIVQGIVDAQNFLSLTLVKDNLNPTLDEASPENVLNNSYLESIVKKSKIYPMYGKSQKQVSFALGLYFMNTYTLYLPAECPLNTVLSARINREWVDTSGLKRYEDNKGGRCTLSKEATP